METVACDWPVVKGDCVSGKEDSCIAVITLASSLEPYGKAAMWGSCKTENLGAEKIIINTISNSNIRYVLLCGNESKGHLAGQTLIALHKNGIDDDGRIIGSEGAIPFVENIGKDAIERFQKQVTIIDRIGLTDIDEIYNIV
ncbi:MAG: tetrahydromethanopterin S-methyltransferase subunit A, partial [Methanococcoides sp.]|nr:tetrahydromethanopterin S-methyltransferase subunit A [Methanococcoides sp.]